MEKIEGIQPRIERVAKITPRIGRDKDRGEKPRKPVKKSSLDPASNQTDLGKNIDIKV